MPYDSFSAGMAFLSGHGNALVQSFIYGASS